jgi:hypothetical protein
MTSPLDTLTSSQIATPPAPVRVDADTFTELCQRPNAQRYIVDGSIHGVFVDGAEYTAN